MSEDTPERARERAAHAAEARQRFTAVARRREERIDLAEAALLIAAEEYPGLDVPAYLARLDDLAQRVRVTARAASTNQTRDPDELAIAALHHVLFEQEALTGDAISGRYHP